MVQYEINDEDSITLTLTSSKLTASINGTMTIVANVMLDRLSTKTPLSESSTYLVVSRKAAEQIYKTDIVSAITVSGETRVKLGANNLTANDAFALGMSLTDAAAGQMVDVLIMGVVKDDVFNAFPLNSTVYLDTDGGTTDIAPSLPLATSRTIIGRSLGSGEILVNVQRPLFL